MSNWADRVNEICEGIAEGAATFAGFVVDVLWVLVPVLLLIFAFKLLGC